MESEKQMGPGLQQTVWALVMFEEECSQMNKHIKLLNFKKDVSERNRRIDAALAKRDAMEQMLLEAHDIKSHSKHRSVFGRACQMYDSSGGA